MKNSILLIAPFILLLTACEALRTSEAKIEPTATWPVFATAKPFPSAMPKIWIGDGGLISGVPCRTPCFFGVRAGETPIDQVVTIFRDNGVYPCAYDDEITIICDDILTGANPETRLVDRLGYYPDEPITVEEVIALYGFPNGVEIIPTGIPEMPNSVALFGFDELNMRLELQEIEGEEYAIVASTRIMFITYFDQLTYLSLKGIQQQWKGYGVYSP